MTRVLTLVGVLILVWSAPSGAAAQRINAVPWGTGILVGEHALMARSGAAFDVSGRYSFAIEANYSLQITDNISIYTGGGLRVNDLCPQRDPSSVVMPVCDQHDESLLALTTGASFLWGADGFRGGWFLDGQVMLGDHSFAAPRAGLEVRYVIVDSEDVAWFVGARVFVEPWIPFDEMSNAPVYFGGAALAAVAFGNREVPPSRQEEIADDLEELVNFTFDELIDHGADPVADCAFGTMSEWGRIATSCRGRLEGELAADSCALFVAHAADERNIDLRARIGGQSFDGDDRDRGAAVQDAATDAWPTVVICNTDTNPRAVILETRVRPSGAVAASIRRYDVRRPRGAADLPDPCGADAPASGACCLAHLATGETEASMGMAAGTGRALSFTSPEYAVGVNVAVADGTTDTSHALETTWSAGEELDIPPEATRITLSSQSVGIPVEVCTLDRSPGLSASMGAAQVDLADVLRGATLTPCITYLGDDYAGARPACAGADADLAPRQCAVFVAAGASGGDVDLEIRSGASTVRDDRPSHTATIVVCNPAIAPVRIETRIRRQDGEPWAALNRYDVAMPVGAAGPACSINNGVLSVPAGATGCWAQVANAARVAVSATATSLELWVPQAARTVTSLGNAGIPTWAGATSYPVSGAREVEIRADWPTAVYLNLP